MKLRRITLRNFRCYRGEVILDVADLTTLIGRNDAGKSALLDSLDIFFNGTKHESLDRSTQCQEPCEIACEFDDLPERIVIDSAVSTTLAEERLLNASGRLEIVKDFCGATPKTFIECIHPSATDFHDLHRLVIKDLRSRAEKVGASLEGVNAKVASAVRRAIWLAAPDLSPVNCRLQVDGKDAESGAKDIYAKVEKYLPLYQLFRADRASTDQDSEAQDPMSLAITQAQAELKEQYDEIVAEVKSRVTSIVQGTLTKLAELSPLLAAELDPVVEPKKHGFNVTLNSDGGIPLNKRGSGVRRMILLSFFRAQAERVVESSNKSSVIYAVEEPETSQHPNFQRMIYQALVQLPDDGASQVILTTHNPNLARLLPVDSLRYIEVRPDRTRSIQAGNDGVYGMVARTLGVVADINLRLFIAVEGPTDEDFFVGISRMLHTEDPELYPDLDGGMNRGEVVFIPTGGSSLAYWTTRLQKIERPEWHIYDGETGEKQKQQRAAADKVNARPGGIATARLTRKREIENYLHPDAIRAAYGHSINISIDDGCDVPELVARAWHSCNGSEKSWDDMSNDDRRKRCSVVKKRLASAAVAHMTPAMLAERDPDGEVINWMRQIAALLNREPGDTAY